MRLLKADLADDAYARQIEAVLPRVLALADRDPLSATKGVGDRHFWAWKLIDFPNGTFQGAVNGLSALLEADAFGPGVATASIRTRIADSAAATLAMMRCDGSFEEALPFEQSYCVTSLALYDHLAALARPASGLAQRDVQALEKAVSFLVARDETHGFISNHLATAVAALDRWHTLTGDPAARAKADLLLDRILESQSREGWFVEYGGADPGYQTLCMTHLADAALQRGDERLWQALETATGFIAHFVHPDGSFGGIYGSRATRIYYPAAMEMLSSRLTMAADIAARMRRSIDELATVPLAAIDQPNLMPIFNNYCQALLAAPVAAHDARPWRSPGGRNWMPEAGLLVDVGERHHTIVAARKGGIVCHWRDGVAQIQDGGLVLDEGRGRVLTAQGGTSETELSGDRLVVTGTLARRVMPLPTPYNFLILRMLALSVMRIPAMGAAIKSVIARLLVRSGGGSKTTFRRQITLGPDLDISDSWTPMEISRVDVPRPFSVIHMASSGYWQKGDDASILTDGPQK